MKNCKNCGAQIDEGSIYCPYCGTRYDEKKKKEKATQDSSFGSGGSYDPKYGYIPNYSGTGTGYGGPIYEGRSNWVAVLCFCFPIVGLILWYTWRFTKPGKADSAANGALAAVSFGSPIIGAALWHIWRYSRREQSKICGIAAIIGAIFALVYAVVAVLLYQFCGIEIFF